MSQSLDVVIKITENGAALVGNSIRKMNTGVVKATKAVTAMTAALSAVTGTATALVNNFANVADSVDKTSSKLGISTDKLQEYRYAAELSGVSSNTFDMALQRMTRRLAEAGTGTGEAVGALKDLGLSAQELSQMTPDEQLAKIADAMQNVTSQSDRVRIAFKLFDSEGVNLVNMLKDGSQGLAEMGDEAQRTGNVISQDGVHAGVEFRDAMKRATATVSGFKNILASELLPTIIELVKGTTEWFQANGKWLAQNISGAIQGIVSAFKVLVDIVGDVFGAFSDLVEALDLTGSTGLSVGEIIGNAFKNAAIIIKTAVESIKVVFKSTFLFIFNIFEYMKINVQLVATFIESAFKNPVKAVLNLFKYLARGVLGYARDIASAIAWVTGSETFDNIAKSLDNLRDSLRQSIDTGDEATTKRIQQLLAEKDAINKAYEDNQREIFSDSINAVVETTYKLYTDDAKQKLDDIKSKSDSVKNDIQKPVQLQFNEQNFLKSLGLDDNRVQEAIAKLDTLRNAQSKLSQETYQLSEAQLKIQALNSIGITDVESLLSATDKLALQREELEKLKKIAEALNIPLEKLQEKMKASAEAAQQAKDGTESLSTAISNFDLKALQSIGYTQLLTDSVNGFGNTLSSTIVEVANGNKTMADGFRDMTVKILADISSLIIKMQVFKAISSSISFFQGGGFGGLFSGFSQGGSVQAFSNGGAVFGAGTATSDSIPAMLSDGEFVMRTRATDAIGRSTLDYMNKYGRLPKYATGGYVSTQPTLSQSMSNNQQVSNNATGQNNIKIVVVSNQQEALMEATNEPQFETKIFDIMKRKQEYL
ncbi:hypothetical protein [Francisella marina]|uniref:hypothetical protein n=1 Tax=Francisella marina TaxID=2249302 RepID=UPI0011F046AB|nr:hypothetical protein [Francisella marina]QEO58328.1 hypothetical protein F0R75_00525 [Francisella marina]